MQEKEAEVIIGSRVYVGDLGSNGGTLGYFLGEFMDGHLVLKHVRWEF